MSRGSTIYYMQCVKFYYVLAVLAYDVLPSLVINNNHSINQFLVHKFNFNKIVCQVYRKWHLNTEAEWSVTSYKYMNIKTRLWVVDSKLSLDCIQYKVTSSLDPFSVFVPKCMKLSVLKPSTTFKISFSTNHFIHKIHIYLTPRHRICHNYPKHADAGYVRRLYPRLLLTH